MTDVQEYDCIDELDRLRPVWGALLTQTPGATFFQSLEWLEVYWKHYGEGQKLRTLVVRSSGEPVGILPLVVRRERTRVGWVRVLTYPLDDWGSFYGPIGPAPGATLATGLEHVRRTRRDWDTVDLRWVGGPGTDHGHTAEAMRKVGFRPFRTVWNRTAVVDLADTWDDYLASKTSKWRNNFRRWERRLAARGKICFIRHRPQGGSQTDADPRWDLYDACEEIAHRSWQGSSTTGTTLTHESVRPYLRETHAVATAAGGVDVNLLLLDEEPLAFAYNYHYRGHVYGLRVGYDAQLARDGAGSLLYAYAIRDSFQRGDHTYDLGVGSLEIKRHFLTQIVPAYRYSYFHPAAPKAQLLRLKRWAEQRFGQKDGRPANRQDPKGATCVHIA